MIPSTEVLRCFAKTMLHLPLHIAKRSEFDTLYPDASQLYAPKQFLSRESFAYLVGQLEEGRPCNVVDLAGASWCLMAAGDDVLMVGPVNTKLITRNEMKFYFESFGGEFSETGAFFHYHTNIPLHNTEQINRFFSVCCQAYEIPMRKHDRTIRMVKRDPLHALAADPGKYISYHHDCTLALMLAVAQGNEGKAKEFLRIVFQMEQSYFQDDTWSETLYFFTAVCFFVRFGARRAGVPPAAIERLAGSYTERALQYRVAESPKQIQPFLESMIDEMCALVHSCSKQTYSPMVSNVVDYIAENYSNDITPGSIAKEFGQNASYLTNRFRRETGETLSGYINQVRLKYARELLSLSDMSIGEIGSRVGIPDQSYFTKLFRREFGVTPTAYREEMFGV